MTAVATGVERDIARLPDDVGVVRAKVNRALRAGSRFGGGVAAITLVLLAAGARPWQAAVDVISGPLTSVDGWVSIITIAIPLVIVASGLCPAFSAGEYNVGAPAQLLVGAVATTWIAVALPSAPGPVVIAAALLGAVAAGALAGLLVGSLRLLCGIDVVISSLLLNSVAVFATLYLLRRPMRDPDAFLAYSERIPRAAQIPDLVGSSLSAAVLVAAAVAAATWWTMHRSTLGLRVRMQGLGRHASEIAGMPSGRVTLAALMYSTGSAALAGGVIILGTEHILTPVITESTVGFSAILVAVLGRLSPARIVAAAIGFAILTSGGEVIQRTQGISGGTVIVVEAVVVLVAVAAQKTRAPR